MISKFLFLGLFLLFGHFHFLLAQPYSFYIGLGPSFHKEIIPTFGLSASLRAPCKWTVSYNWQYHSFDSPNKPADFKAGGFGIFRTYALDNFSIESMRIGRDFFINDAQFICGFDIGPARIRYDESVFTPVPENEQKLLGSNYSIDTDIHRTIGLGCRAKLVIPFSKYIGIELAPSVLLNKYHNVYQIDTYINIGKIK